MNLLIIIPARGGSKGIPHKNIKFLAGKPLICHSIDIARSVVSDRNICVSTDDAEIKRVVEDYGLPVPFLRPSELASDHASTYGVILHALDYYALQGKEYDAVVLLQPTSPFRRVDDVKSCLDKYTADVDMVVSVKEAASNPYYDCFELNKDGYLVQSKGDGRIIRRQDAPEVYEFTGSVYVMNVRSLRSKDLNAFTKIVALEVDELHSLDLDTMLDWKFAELLIKKKMIEL